MNAMNGKKFLVKSWVTALIAVAFACWTGAATAEIVSTEQALQQSDRERVQEILNRAEVEDVLKTLGVAPGDIRQRVNAMTPEEVRTVAGRMDTLAAGGDASATDWIIILLGVVVIILLV
ncbi:MAG TPA: PA2779 family protein [Burkholderiales bacterium]|nr:PA2779 family protein [Burkholderiales bacterium]